MGEEKSCKDVARRIDKTPPSTMMKLKFMLARQALTTWEEQNVIKINAQGNETSNKVRLDRLTQRTNEKFYLVGVIYVNDELAARKNKK
jgi:hypothetical protein